MHPGQYFESDKVHIQMRPSLAETLLKNTKILDHPKWLEYDGNALRLTWGWFYDALESLEIEQSCYRKLSSLNVEMTTF